MANYDTCTRFYTIGPQGITLGTPVSLAFLVGSRAAEVSDQAEPCQQYPWRKQLHSQCAGRRLTSVYFPQATNNASIKISLLYDRCLLQNCFLVRARNLNINYLNQPLQSTSRHHQLLTRWYLQTGALSENSSFVLFFFGRGGESSRFYCLHTLTLIIASGDDL